MTIDTKALFKAKKALNDFLREYPNMKGYQSLITSALDKAGSNPHNRLAVLTNLMVDNKKHLLTQLNKLLESLNECKTATNNYRLLKLQEEEQE